MSYRPQLKTSGGMVDFPLDAETVKGKTILEQTYPVGAIYISDNNTSPASLFGGTWQQLNSGNKCYIAGSDVPVATNSTKIDTALVGGELKMGFVNNGEWGQRSSNQYAIIEATNGRLATSNQGSVPSPFENAIPENLWAKISDSGHGVYMWKRTA